MKAKKRPSNILSISVKPPNEPGQLSSEDADSEPETPTPTPQREECPVFNVYMPDGEAYLVRSKSGQIPVIRVSDNELAEPRQSSSSEPVDASEVELESPTTKSKVRVTRKSSKSSETTVPKERFQRIPNPNKLGAEAVRPAKTHLRPGQNRPIRHALRGPDGKFLKAQSDGD